MPRASKPALPPPAFRRTSGQVTAEYPVARRTLYRWGAEGLVDVWRFNSRNLYDARQIEALIRPQDRRAS